MPQPTPWDEQYRFADYAASNQPPPGPALDAEFDAGRLTTQEILRNLALIQRDDGRLRNASVAIDQLAPDVVSLIGSSGFVVRGAWAVGVSYQRGDLVSSGGVIYLAMSAHVSAALLATDTAAGRMVAVFDTTNDVSRALLVPEGDAQTGQMVLPSVASRAGLLAAYDANGRPAAVTPASVGVDASLRLDLLAAGGADRVGYSPAGTVQDAIDALNLRLNIGYRISDPKRFGAIGNGVADDTAAIQAAIDYGSPLVQMDGSQYRITSSLFMREGVRFEGYGKAKTGLLLGGNFTPFVFANVNDASVQGFLVVAGAAQTSSIVALNATSQTITRNLVRDVQVSGLATDFPFISLATATGAWGNWKHTIENVAASGCGTLLRCETGAANSWINSIYMVDVFANDFIRGIHLLSSGGDGCSDSSFAHWATQTSARTQFGLLIPDVSTVGVCRKNSLHDVSWYDLVNGDGVGWFIGQNVLDTNLSGFGVDDPTPSRFIDEGIGTLINGMSPFDYMNRQGREVFIPTNAGLTPAVSGTGTTQANVSFAQVRSGATAGSLARQFSADAVAGLAPNSVFNTDFGRALRVSFTLARIGSGASAIGRVQFKTVTTDGILAAAGLGIQINNYGVTGESYGTALGTVSLGLTLVDSQSYRFEIIHYPGERVEFWVDGVYRAQITAANALPTGSAACYMHQSMSNVAANDCQQVLTQVRIKAGR